MAYHTRKGGTKKSGGAKMASTALKKVKQAVPTKSMPKPKKARRK